MPPLEHSDTGASSAYRWIACPGSIRLIRELLASGYKKKSSVYADKGSAEHHLGETCLRDGSEVSSHLDEIITLDNTATFVVDEDMIEAVSVYVAFVRGLVQKMPSAKLEIEKAFDLAWLYPGLRGTTDSVLREDFGLLVVNDYKGGMKKVSASNNPQGMYYALGAMGSLDNHNNVEMVEINIIQPHIFGNAVDTFRITPEELVAWGRNVLKPAAEECEKPDAKLCAGDHCCFCDAKAVCPELQKTALELAKQTFPPFELPAVITLPSPSDLNPEQLARVKNFADLMTGWIKSVEEYVFQQLSDGKYIPGLKLIETSRNSRDWTDELKTVEALKAKGFNADDLFEKKILSPAKMEKLVKGQNMKPDQVLGSLITTTANKKFAVVDESDSRPAITKAAEVFDTL